MTGTQYLILAHVAGLALLLGYAIVIWRHSRALSRRVQVARPTPAESPDR